MSAMVRQLLSGIYARLSIEALTGLLKLEDFSQLLTGVPGQKILEIISWPVEIFQMEGKPLTDLLWRKCLL